MSLRSPIPLLLALATIALPVGGCGGREEPAPATQRLLTQTRPARWATMQPVTWGSPALRQARMVRGRHRERIARVAMLDVNGKPDERLALLVAPDASERFTVGIPTEGRLLLAYAAVQVGGTASEPIEMRAQVRSTASGEVLAEITDRRRPEEGWRDAVLDLPATDDPTATVVLSTRGEREGLWGAWSTPEVRRRGAEPGWSVLLISLDTLRADHLGVYGAARETSPHLDGYAARTFSFSQAVTHAPWTLPAHRALFTGFYPRAGNARRQLPLAEMLWRHGYRTAALAGGGQLDYRRGLARGFEFYREADWIRDPEATAAFIAEDLGRRSFHFLHTYEPHDPYIDARFASDLPPGSLAGYFDSQMWRTMKRHLSDEEKAYIEALYDGDIAFTDRQLGKLLDALDRHGVFEHTIVIITSDHGEQFWEHGTWRHGQSLYDHQLRVPLIVSLPPRLRRSLKIKRSAAEVDDQVRLIDIVPTILELLDIEPKTPPQGRSLLPLLRGDELPPVPSLAEDLNVINAEAKAIRYRGYKLISRVDGDGEEKLELYDLRNDPGESHNLAAERPDTVARLRQQMTILTGLEWWREKSGETPHRDLPEDLRQRLKALGYLGN